MLSLVQLAQTTFRLHHPLAEEALVRAEAAYVQGVQYLEQLPENERTSMSFHLGRLRTTLDELHSAEEKMK